MNFCHVGQLIVILMLSNTIFLNLAIANIGHVPPNAHLPQVKDALSQDEPVFSN
jgi:hypothetical protein